MKDFKEAYRCLGYLDNLIIYELNNDKKRGLVQIRNIMHELICEVNNEKQR